MHNDDEFGLNLTNNGSAVAELKLKSATSVLFQSASFKKQRERTTFDPQEEITRLMQIFEKTHHPTRYQIANICEMLNSLACRKDKKPLEPYNIQYWFKNARAALRRKLKDDKTKSDDIINSYGAVGVKSPSNDDSNNEDLEYDANFNFNFDSDANNDYQSSSG